jgi:hypothetical protein
VKRAPRKAPGTEQQEQDRRQDKPTFGSDQAPPPLCPDLPPCGCAADAAAAAQDRAAAELPRALVRLLLLALAGGAAGGSAFALLGCVWACRP